MSRAAILLVEDDRLSRTATAALLTEAGYEVRAAAGAEDLEKKAKADPAFLSNLALIILDIELYENLGRSREDKSGTHTGMAMTGTQLGLSLALAYPELRKVPFVVYSARDPAAIQASLDEMASLLEMEGFVQQNFRGFVVKDEHFADSLLYLVRLIVDSAG